MDPISWDEQAEERAAAGLVQRVRSGDRRAEAEMVERYSRGLAILLRSLAGERALADDLHQETFRLALEKIRAGQLREPGKLNAFLRQVARNLAIAEHRRGSRREGPALAADELPAAPEESPLRRLLQNEAAGLVRRTLDGMRSPRDREVLYRFYIAEEDKERICADLGLSSAHFNLVLHRARERFRQLVSERQSGAVG
jgi:RNA polymerase sigma-70 factor, ECF subfamily